MEVVDAGRVPVLAELGLLEATGLHLNGNEKVYRPSGSSKRPQPHCPLVATIVRDQLSGLSG